MKFSQKKLKGRASHSVSEAKSTASASVPISTPTMASQLIQLQKSVGNRATSLYLQRRNHKKNTNTKNEDPNDEDLDNDVSNRKKRTFSEYQEGNNDWTDDENDSEYELELDPDLEEVDDELSVKIWDKYRQKRRKLSGKKVMGDILEKISSRWMKDLFDNELNTNDYVHNMPGIDHIVDHPDFPFIQDKMHLSEQTATVQQYRQHYKARYEWAGKMLNRMVAEGKSGNNARTMFQKVLEDDQWQNKDLIREVLEKVNESLEDKEFDDDFVEKVAKHIGIPVPRDIWEKLHVIHEKGTIPKEEMKAYFRLDVTTDDIRRLMELYDGITSSPKEKKEEDPEYID